jgi:hypothetical protein
MLTGMGVSLVLVVVASAVVLWWGPGRQAEHRATYTLRATCVVALLAGAGIGLRAAADLRAEAPLSDPVTREAPEIGPGVHVLRSDLRDATVVTPNRPHTHEEVHARDRKRRITRLHSFLVSTNSMGLRSPEVTVPAQRTRILCIGDSVTMGWGYDVEHSYPSQLAQLLDVEVINAGMPGFTPGAIATWLEKNVRRLDVDLVIFGRRPDLVMPDPWSDYARALTRVVSVARPAQVAVVLPPLSTFDPQGEALHREELERVHSAAGSLPVLDLTPVFREQATGGGVVMRREGDLQKLVRVEDDAVMTEGRAAEGELAAEVIAAFEEDPDLSEPLFSDGGHPDRAGYALMAREVSSWIGEQGLLVGAGSQ